MILLFVRFLATSTRPSILLSFLNAILKLDGNKRIQEVTIINPYLLPRVAGEKASIIDIRAKDARGQQFVIEMQVADVHGFDKRVQYYTCRDYSTQINKGEQYQLLKPTYFIGILDFNFFEGTHYLSHHIIVNGETYEHKLKDIQFTFIELGKFQKTTAELKSLVEKWVFFIKNAENLSLIPENTTDQGLTEAYKDADKHSWEKEELIAYDNASIAIQDARGRLAFAEEAGRAKGKIEGLEQGLQQGIAKEKQQVVEKCWRKNMSIEDIAEITELPVEAIQTIIEQLE